MRVARRIARFSRLAALVAFLCVPAVRSQEGHAHQHGSPEALGSVHFKVSCSPEAQSQFNRAVALLHSFWYDEAEKAFTRVTLTDPRCGMGHWGVAMSRYHPIWAAPGADDLKAGRAAVERARAIGAGSEREKDYIAAIEVFYTDWGKVDHLTRAIAYEEAMRRVFERHPEDHEAGVFYALAILGRALPTDKTYAHQKRAAEILNRILPEEPEHPGIAHYMIHSYDYPELASLALPAARAYAKIAPDAPHALHMPSHIFTRLGMWEDSIRSNLTSAESAWRQIAKGRRDMGTFDQLHAMDYLEYAYLQIGRDDLAKQVLEDLGRVRRLDREIIQAAYAFAAIPARYALERGRWEEAAALEVRPAWFPWERFRSSEANVHFARALGAARSGRPEAARAAAERLASIHEALVKAKDAEWGDRVEILRLAAAGWAARAAKKDDEALELLRSAARLDDSIEKHPVTPGAIAPARELLADLLLDLGRPREALEEYEAVLRVAPKRLRATAGAARAAELAGDRARAQAHHADLLSFCDSASTRPETRAAKAFVAGAPPAL
jgi:tetratricopeptide (TPR) repeat protein